MTGSALAIAFALVFSSVASADAQQRPGFTIDLTGGAGTAFGVEDRYDNFMTLGSGLTLARRGNPATTLTPVYALGLGGQTRFSGTDVCILLPGARCAPDFPSVYHVGALAGAEYHGLWLPIRLLVGPAFYFGEGPSGGGGLVQLDVATPTLGHVAFVVSGRTSYVARVTGERLQLGALGVGIRIE